MQVGDLCASEFWQEKDNDIVGYAFIFLLPICSVPLSCCLKG